MYCKPTRKIFLVLGVILSVMALTTVVSFASSEDSTTVYDGMILEKYKTVYDSLEKRLEESVVADHNIVDEKCLMGTNRIGGVNGLQVLTESLMEGDSLVTLGIAASTVTQTIPEQKVFTHAMYS